MLLQLYQNLFCNIFQSLENTWARDCDCLKIWDILRVEEFVHVFEGCYAREVSFIILDRVWEFIEVIALLCEVDSEVIEAFDVRLHPLYLAVCNKNHAINTFEDELSACSVKYLAGDSVEVEPHLETLDVAERKGEKIEKKRALGLCGQGD